MVDEATLRPLRFVVLGGSIVSDWDNPVATSARAVLNELTAQGHEATFLERRGNETQMAMLRARGSRAMRSFFERFPSIQYRTYDLPRGWERTVWFGREVGTADAVIALPGTPPELIPEMVAMPKLHIARFVDESFEVEHECFRLVRATADTGQDGIAFGPAVTTRIGKPERSSRLVVVAYDDDGQALSVAAQLAPVDPLLISTGTAILPRWNYVPEIELPGLYRGHRAAVVVGAGPSDWARARELLAVASGCVALDPASDMTTPDEAIRNESPTVPPQLEASAQAAAIISAARTALLRS